MIVFGPVVQNQIREQVHLFRHRIATFVAVRVLIRKQVFGDVLPGVLGALAENLVAKPVLHTLTSLAVQQFYQFVYAPRTERIQVTTVFLHQHLQLFLVLTTVFFRGACEQFGVDNNAFQRWWCLFRSIFHIASLIAEDGAEQFLFRRRVAFSFWRNLADQDIAFLHLSAHTHDTVFVEVTNRLFRYVRDF